MLFWRLFRLLNDDKGDTIENVSDLVFIGGFLLNVAGG